MHHPDASDEEYSVEDQFLDAARSNDVEGLRRILLSVGGATPEATATERARVINTEDPQSGATALHMAVANGHREVVTFLLSECVPRPLYKTNSSGNTPLHWAVQRGQWDIAGLLLSSSYADSIDVLAQNTFGKSVLGEALQHPDVLSQPSVQPEADTAATNDLMVPVSTPAAEIVSRLLQHPSAAALEQDQ